VRHVIAIVIVAAGVAGCGHGVPPERTVAPSHPHRVTTRSSAPSGKPGASGPVTLPAIGCPTPTCAFHAGASGYFTCLAGGAGACFHFGPPCAPPDSCMYDPGDRSYKQCARASEGTCQQWGAACAPATKCMFNPGDGLHHQCDDVAGGTCKHYGALCPP
jgi:hypothetical protein